jgi:AraC-like DNA-binding protein
MKLTGFTNYATFHHSVIKGTMPRSIGRPKTVTFAQIEQAKALYATGELSINKIMKIVGFKSPNTFYKYVLYSL